VQSAAHGAQIISDSQLGDDAIGGRVDKAYAEQIRQRSAQGFVHRFGIHGLLLHLRSIAGSCYAYELTPLRTAPRPCTSNSPPTCGPRFCMVTSWFTLGLDAARAF
jgi:hypothetical protein